MDNTLPQGSKITIDTVSGHQQILVPHGSGGFMRYFIGIFLLFWMGGWFMGFLITIEIQPALAIAVA